jgi:uncharacterized protein
MVDSCGWLEFFLGDRNRAFFEPVLADTQHLLLPPLVVYEVCRRIHTLYDASAAERAFRAMSTVPIAQLDANGMFAASLASQRHKLHMADAIIWQTAQAHGATLYTQDAALQGLPGVAYQART